MDARPSHHPRHGDSSTLGATGCVSLIFATGTKTILNAAAGLIRMPFGIYLPAMVLGCIAHSLIYSLVGWAAWVAAVQAAAGSPLGLALFILALIAIIAVIIMKRRRLDTARSTPPRG